MVARSVVAGRVEGSEDRHPAIRDTVLYDVGLVALINL